MLNSVPRPQPLGVSVVGVLLLVQCLFSLVWLMSIFVSPRTRMLVELSYRSIPLLVFFILLNAGLSLACGIGILLGRKWARGLYLGFVPVLLIVSAFNGFPPTMLVGVVQYLIFAYILTRPSAVHYFHEPPHYGFPAH